MLEEIAGLDVQLLGELFDRDAFGERDLAGRLLEVEHLRVRIGLLAGITAGRSALGALPRFFEIGQDDVRTDVVIDDLRSGERSLVRRS